MCLYLATEIKARCCSSCGSCRTAACRQNCIRTCSPCKTTACTASCRQPCATCTTNQCMATCRETCDNCATTQCRQTCARSCESCTQCSSCKTSECRQKCNCKKDCDKKKIIEVPNFGGEKGGASTNSQNQTTNFNADLKITNTLDNENIIHSPVSVNASMVNNIKITGGSNGSSGGGVTVIPFTFPFSFPTPTPSNIYCHLYSEVSYNFMFSVFQWVYHHQPQKSVSFFNKILTYNNIIIVFFFNLFSLPYNYTQSTLPWWVWVSLKPNHSILNGDFVFI